MVRNKPTFRWMHDYMRKFNTEIACFRLGGTHVITVSSPEISRKFLKEQDVVFASRPKIMSARLTSNGFLSVAHAPAGAQWKKMRRIMTSEVLTKGVHELFHAKICEEADRLVKYVYNQSANGAVNVREAARFYCGGVIRKMVFGKSSFGPGIEDKEHMDGLFTVLSYLYGFSICDYVPFLEMFDLDGHKRIVTDALECLRKYHDPQINDRVEMWRNHDVTNTNEDILDILINLKNSNNDPLLSIQEIKAQVNDICLAAIDNPSNAVEWALAEMINEPRILHSASEELDKVVGRKRLVQESDLPRLNYVKACVKEAFRLHPVAPFNLPHVSTIDTIVGGYFIPKGSHVLLSRLGLGRNPRVWEDPLKFKPERHITDESSIVELNDPELQMLSFSIGRRSCPGIKLGSTMATVLLARLIQGFSWKSPSSRPLVDLVESHNNLSLAKPLIAHATPRLGLQVYHQLL